MEKSKNRNKIIFLNENEKNKLNKFIDLDKNYEFKNNLKISNIQILENKIKVYLFKIKKSLNNLNLERIISDYKDKINELSNRNKLLFDKIKKFELIKKKYFNITTKNESIIYKIKKNKKQFKKNLDEIYYRNKLNVKDYENIYNSVKQLNNSIINTKTNIDLLQNKFKLTINDFNKIFKINYN